MVCHPLSVRRASRASHQATAAPFADGVVVGSVFVRLIAENSGRDDLVALVAGFAKDIKEGMQRGPAR